MKILPAIQISPEERVEQMVKRLQESGHRITPQRHFILKILAHSQGHPSAEDIYMELIDNFPTMSLATVWQDFVSSQKRRGSIGAWIQQSG